MMGDEGAVFHFPMGGWAWPLDSSLAIEESIPRIPRMALQAAEYLGLPRGG
jgi:hypothetical protein